MNYFSILFWLLGTSFALGEPDYRGQFYEQFYQSDFPGMETTLKAWQSSCPDEVEVLAAYGSYYRRKAGREPKAGLVKSEPRKNIALNRTKTSGKIQKGPSPPPFDRKGLLKAADYLKKALQQYPSRLDIRFDLAGLYRDMNDFESQYRILAEALQYADKRKKKLSWSNNGRLPESPSKFIPESMQDYETFYFDQQRLESDEKAFRLAKLTLTFYPNHPFAYNSIAAYYSLKNDWEHTLKYLLIASRKAPKDSLILCNIGNTLVQLGKKKEAKIFYEKVIRLGKDSESMEIARNYLKEHG